MENLDLTSFKNAIKSLKEALDIYSNDFDNSIVRDSVIQRFEYTYSLALKFLKRYFKSSAFVLDDIESMTFNEIIRQSNKMNLLLSNLEIWNDFRQKRNMTSHTYDENIAKQV